MAEIIAKKAMQEKALEETNQAVKNIRELLSSFTPEMKELLVKYNCDAEFFDSIDIDRLVEDSQYLTSIREKADICADKIYSVLSNILE